jgi:hypothetical protein
VKFFCKIKNGKIVPEYASDYDKVAKLRPDTEYQIEIRKPRNVQFHRKFFSLLSMVMDNQDAFDNIEELRAYLTMKAGYYKRVVTKDGEMYLPQSISFANMDDIEFSGFYSRVLDVVCQFLDIQSDEVARELVNYM